MPAVNHGKLFMFALMCSFPSKACGQVPEFHSHGHVITQRLAFDSSSAKQVSVEQPSYLLQCDEDKCKTPFSLQ
jgi:hypothetical protein